MPSRADRFRSKSALAEEHGSGELATLAGVACGQARSREEGIAARGPDGHAFPWLQRVPGTNPGTYAAGVTAAGRGPAAMVSHYLIA